MSAESGAAVGSLADQWSHLLDSFAGSSTRRLSTHSIRNDGVSVGGGAGSSALHAAEAVICNGNGSGQATNGDSGGTGAGGLMKTILRLVKSKKFIVGAGVVAIAVVALVAYVLYRRYVKRRDAAAGVGDGNEDRSSGGGGGGGVRAVESIALDHIPISEPTTRPLPSRPTVVQRSKASPPQSSPPTPRFSQLPPPPTPAKPQPPVAASRAAPQRDQMAQQPSRGVESEAPRNVGGENDMRAFHKRYMDDDRGSGKDKGELPHLPPPDMGAPVVVEPTAAAVEAVAAAAEEVASPPKVEVETSGDAKPLSEDPNFIPLK